MIDPAFPVPLLTNGDGVPKWPGVSKRELAAMFALSGMIAGSQGIEISAEQFGAQSVKLADSLLASLAASTEEK